MKACSIASSVIHPIEELLARRVGLDAKSLGPQALKRAVAQRAKTLSLPSPQAYWDRLRADPRELPALVDLLVVPETWFLREPEALTALVREVEVRRDHSTATSKLRILSAPCATGEEPLSIVIALLDAGWSSDSIEVVAGDISERNLAKAASGCYQANSFRSRELGFRNRYFEPGPTGFRAQARLMRPIRLDVMNLVTRDFGALHEPFDFIFCRNLLIYLHPEARRHVLDNLFSVLRDGGGLFVGAAECGYLSRQLFQSEQVNGSFVFRKRASRAGVGRLRDQADPLSPIAPATPDRLVSEASQRAPIAAGNKTVLERARQLADAGSLSEAAGICEALLRNEGGSAEALYLLGVVRDAEGSPREAEALYRKALYLDPGCYEAILQLSLNRERGGDAREARMLHERARRLKASGESQP
ncbi:MAG: chemotaxis protein CheW [Verrucomicrobia bacterium]|nr:chemotaxis protein CheW [Verrucomicrobiota bacterium]